VIINGAVTINYWEDSMHLEIIESKGLAHNSYYLSDAEEALVVDPRRDCGVYLQKAREDCAKIRYILETHRNEDYVIGSLELQHLTDAEIAHSKETPFKYGEHSLGDGDTLQLGNLKIEVLDTPGHTNDSLCYAVYEKNVGTPLMVFTGDTLFTGDVGRTDLLGKGLQREQSARLFKTLHEKVLTIDDHVIVYPGHGGGSVCGHHISDREVTTIGYEKQTNPLFKMNRDEFVETLMRQKLLKPHYFAKMEQLNLDGPALIPETIPWSLDIDQFEKEMNQPATVIVDTREPGAFASSHIPNSINIWLDGLTFFPGWVLTYEQKILLVTERREDVEDAETYLRRLGFDNIGGYLCWDIERWRYSGKPIDHLGTLSAAGLKQKLNRDEINVVDVRAPSEWKGGVIEGAQQIYVGHLTRQIKRIPKDKAIASVCSVGNRAGIGASILKKAGFKEVYNVLGGMLAWEKLGYQTKKEYLLH
jgi:hydroxyacylglutathione hydrolase